MYVGTDFSPVEVGEVINEAFDFVNDLAPLDTIVSATWACSVDIASSIQDPSAASLPVGTPSVSGTVVAQQLSGFVFNVTYILEATATTAQGEQLKLWSRVYCGEPD